MLLRSANKKISKKRRCIYTLILFTYLLNMGGHKYLVTRLPIKFLQVHTLAPLPFCTISMLLCDSELCHPHYHNIRQDYIVHWHFPALLPFCTINDIKQKTIYYIFSTKRLTCQKHLNIYYRMSYQSPLLLLVGNRWNCHNSILTKHRLRYFLFARK